MLAVRPIPTHSAQCRNLRPELPSLRVPAAGRRAGGHRGCSHQLHHHNLSVQHRYARRARRGASVRVTRTGPVAWQARRRSPRAFTGVAADFAAPGLPESTQPREPVLPARTRP